MSFRKQTSDTSQRAAVASLAFGMMMATASVSSAQVASATSIKYKATWASAKCAQGTDAFDTATNTWRVAVGAHVSSLSANDATAFWTELTDPSHGGTDNVNGNLDDADIALLATHGGSILTPASCYTTESASCDYTGWTALLTTESGHPSNGCSASTVDMEIGNSQTEYLDVFACNSAEKRGSEYIRDASERLHQWHGFAGTMGTGIGSNLDDYMDDAFDGSAALAWVTNMTGFDHWGGPSDVCATSWTRGNTAQDARDRSNRETYSRSLFSDPTGSSLVLTYYTTCDPPSPIPGQMGDWAW